MSDRSIPNSDPVPQQDESNPGREPLTHLNLHCEGRRMCRSLLLDNFVLKAGLQLVQRRDCVLGLGRPGAQLLPTLNVCEKGRSGQTSVRWGVMRRENQVR